MIIVYQKNIHLYREVLTFLKKLQNNTMKKNVFFTTFQRYCSLSKLLFYILS